jgi:AAA domain
MVIWLNGPFGVGKTTVAHELVRLTPDARIADPERIGYVMKRAFWRKADYQDVALWRRLTVRQVHRQARRGTVIVPMTVVDPVVFAEITAGARVFALTAPRDIIAARIDAGDEAHGWRHQNLDRCLKAFETDSFGEGIDTEGRTPLEIAQLIASAL